MKKATGVLDRVIDYQNMLNAVKECCKGKRYNWEALTFQENLAGNILELTRAMQNGSYETAPYRERLVYIPQTRLIQVSAFRDRVAQQAIWLVLKHILEPQYIHDSYACTKGKGAHMAVQRIQYWLRQIHRKPNGRQYVCGKIDVAKFFYRLDHNIVLRVMRQYIDDETFMRVMENIIRCKHTAFGLPAGKSCTDVPREERLFDVGVPIGSLVSQTVANMVLNEVDQYAKHVLKIHYYIRYMDDMVFFAPDKQTAHAWIAEISAFMERELKLQCNRKTQILPMAHGVPFVGRKIWGTHIIIRKSTSQHMKKALKHLAKQYAAGTIGHDEVMHSLSSYFGLLKHANSHGLRQWIADNIVFTREAKPPDEPGTDNPISHHHA